MNWLNTVNGKITESAPTIPKLMWAVILSLLPGTVFWCYYFEGQPLLTLFFCITAALFFETLVLKIRQHPIKINCFDGSAIITGWLIALALPPTSPWWVCCIASGSAIVIAKHLYGGLGANPFNPAMVGYAIVLLSFPETTTNWQLLDIAMESSTIDGVSGPTLLESIQADSIQTDGQTDGQTDTQKTETQLLTIKKSDVWTNGLFAIGGLWLLWTRKMTWHIPIGVLVGLGACASIGWGFNTSLGSPALHFFSGATMLGAFFVATDPVSSATSKTGKIFYAFGIGVLLYLIRIFGDFPDGVAFAVLLMNAFVPMIDLFTQPKLEKTHQ